MSINQHIALPCSTRNIPIEEVIWNEVEQISAVRGPQNLLRQCKYKQPWITNILGRLEVWNWPDHPTKVLCLVSSCGFGQNILAPLTTGFACAFECKLPNNIVQLSLSYIAKARVRIISYFLQNTYELVRRRRGAAAAEAACAAVEGLAERRAAREEA